MVPCNIIIVYHTYPQLTTDAWRCLLSSASAVSHLNHMNEPFGCFENRPVPLDGLICWNGQG